MVPEYDESERIMSKDQTYGAVILVASIVGLIVYSWLLYSYALIVLQLTAFVAVALVLVITGWIGWTMATTPPPAPLDVSPPSEKIQ
jgi:predicted DNA-binding transcriptional regulator